MVATPIGNLGDMTPRAVQILRDVTLIAAEDTRHSRKLMTHFDIHTPLLSYHQHNRRSRRDALLAALSRGNVALITDAGTPAISDPGAELVAAALAAGYTVSPVPGPSALAAAVSVSGLADGPFVHLGFLPRNASERRSMLSRAAATGFPIVVFESPQRLGRTLDTLIAVLGDRPAVMSRELTKAHEEVRLSSLSDIRRWTAAQQPRGEIVLVVASDRGSDSSVEDIDEVLRMLRRSGYSLSQTAREAAAITGQPRSELYKRAAALERESSVGLEREFPSPDEDALQNALGDEERPQR